MKNQIALCEDFDIRDCFKLFDRDGKGFLLSADMDLALKNLGIQATRDEIYCLILSNSAYMDGSLKYTDFVAMLSSHTSLFKEGCGNGSFTK